MSLTTSPADPEPETTQPVYPEPFAGEIANAKRAAMAAIEANDPGAAIAHCRAMRSAIYRATEDARRIW